MKTKKSKTNKGLVIWTKPLAGGLNIQSQWNKNSLLDFLKKHENEWVKMTFAPMTKSKTATALGYLFGVLYPFYLAKRKDLHFDPLNIDELLKQKKITTEEIEDTHFSFTTEFRGIMVYDLKGKPTLQRGEIKKYNNTQLLAYITEVVEYLETNYGEVPDCEEYKELRDKAKLIREEGLQAIEYPDCETPTF